MGIGKYFHRDKSHSPKASKNRSRATSFGEIDPSLQTSRYEAMPPAGLPQTGTYPLKGNNSTAAVTGQNSAFRHSMDNRHDRSTRPETAPSHPTTTTTRTTTTTTTTAAPPRIETPNTNNNYNFSDYQFFDHDQQDIPDRGNSLENRRMQQDTGLELNFSGMRLANEETAGSATSPPISYYAGSGSASHRVDPRVDSMPRKDPGVRTVNQVGQQPNSPSYGKQRASPHRQYSPSYDSQAANRSYDQRLVNQVGQQPSSPRYGNSDTSPQQRHSPSYDTQAASRSYDQRLVNQAGQQPNSARYGNSGTSPQQQHSPSYDTEGASRSYDQTPATSPAKQRVRDNYPSEVDEAKAARRASIPRKQIGIPGHAPSPSVPSTSLVSPNHPSRTSDQVPPPVPRHGDYPSQQSPYTDPASLPQQRTPVQGSSHQDLRAQSQYDQRLRQGEYRHPSAVPRGLNYDQRATNDQADYSQSHVPPLFPRAQPTSGGAAANYPADEIVQRAHTNTKDTEVIERIAPAVVQEQVIEKIHKKREEVITREIHTHDVYHRILPIIDVEVLPPRHFLPVEGGGLVEIGADEVPGRAQNWVIAETASKIPSDQPAPKGASSFTARQFPGREGDKVEYITPDGVKRTEETWVHPPDLETGGKDTGQTWPMVFGREDGGKEARIRPHGHSSSRDGKKRGKNRHSSGSVPGGYSSSY